MKERTRKKKVLILFYSTTGNTRLVAGRLAAEFTGNNLAAVLRDPVAEPKFDDVGSFDLVGFGAPTMAWKPSYGFDEALGLLPGLKKPKPAFVFCTSGGQPINTLRIMSEMISRKGFVVLDGIEVTAETNWPVARQFGGKAKGFVGKPDEKDLARLGPFVSELVQKLERGETSPRVFEFLRHPLHYVGIASGRAQLRRAMGTKSVDTGKCIQCARCAQGCAARAIALRPYPVFSDRCMGCWSCYNKCPTEAIRTTVTGGRGRYKGPALRT